MNQFLSQDEVDALLRGISEGEVETEQDAGMGGGRGPRL
jgi:flagellar motor switch protein FliM